MSKEKQDSSASPSAIRNHKQNKAILLTASGQWAFEWWVPVRVLESGWLYRETKEFFFSTKSDFVQYFLQLLLPRLDRKLHYKKKAFSTRFSHSVEQTLITIVWFSILLVVHTTTTCASHARAHRDALAQTEGQSPASSQTIHRSAPEKLFFCFVLRF